MKEKVKLIINWLKDPITKGYIESLKLKEVLIAEKAKLIMEEAVISGKTERTSEEIAIFNHLRSYREELSDLLPYYELAHKEVELTLEEATSLGDFFDNITKK